MINLRDLTISLQIEELVETDGRVVATISSHLKELQLMGKLVSLLG
jgi:hypothetical protein